MSPCAQALAVEITDLAVKLDMVLARLEANMPRAERITAGLLSEFAGTLAGKSKKHREEVVATVKKFAAGKDHSTESACAWLDELHASGLAARTCNKKGDHLSQFGTWWAAKTGATNPYALAKLPRWNPSLDRRKVRRALTKDEAGRLLRAARTPYRRRLYDFLLSTGWRLGQTCKLEWTDVDWQNKVLHVRPEITKSRRASSFPLTPHVEALLKERYDRAVADGDTSPLVWPQRPLTKTFYADVSRAQILNEDRAIDFHSLRATFCTELQRSGVPLSMAQLLMDHGDPKITAKHYTLYELSEQRAALEKISGDLSEGVANLSPDHEVKRPERGVSPAGVAHRYTSGPAVGDAAEWESEIKGLPPFLTIQHVAVVLAVPEFKALRLVRANHLRLKAAKWGREWRVPAAKLAEAIRGEFTLRWDPPA